MTTVEVGQSTGAEIGPQVARRTDVAGIIFKRWMGCWVDFIAAAACGFLCGVLLGIPLYALGGDALIGIGFAMGMLGYYLLLEARWGRTLGKLLTGLKVVNAAGEAPGMKKALIRTLLRLVEVNPFLLGGIPAGLVAANSRHRQRLGDMAAQTYVVSVRDLQAARSKGAESVFD